MSEPTPAPAKSLRDRAADFLFTLPATTILALGGFAIAMYAGKYAMDRHDAQIDKIHATQKEAIGDFKTINSTNWEKWNQQRDADRQAHSHDIERISSSFDRAVDRMSAGKQKAGENPFAAK